MAPLGFNAHALGLLAKRSCHAIVGQPQALAAHVTMLRSHFHPWGDALADDISKTKITALCLPAVAPDTMRVIKAGSELPVGSQVSQLHRAVLVGPSDLLRYTAPGLRKHMRTLVAAGLFVDEAEARRGSLQLNKLLVAHKLEWYMERRVAVLEVGGTSDVVHAACAATHSLRTLLARLLLYKLARCVISHVFTSSNALPQH